MKDFSVPYTALILLKKIKFRIQHTLKMHGHNDSQILFSVFNNSMC